MDDAGKLERLAKMAVRYGLGVVLAITITGWNGWLTWKVMKDSGARERALISVIQVEVKDNSEKVNRMASLIATQQSSFQDFVERTQRQSEELIRTLAEMTFMLRQVNSALVKAAQ